MMRRPSNRPSVGVVLAAVFLACGGPVVQHASAADRQDGRAAGREPNSAHRLLFWTGAKEVAGLTDEELDAWKDRGVGGFICMTRKLRGMGGTQDFTGDPAADLAAAGCELQRTLRDSQLTRRAHDRGLKMYLGCQLVNYYNPATPLKDWFDDAGWADVVVPRVREFASAARQLGFDGIAFDQELYPQSGKRKTATWAWNYPGNTHTEAEVRHQARQRGAQLMSALLEGWPGVELVVYHFQFPGTWWPVVQKEVNKIEDAAAPLLFVDFYDGMTSVEGFRAIRFINALFYKTPHRGTWEAAFQYEYNGFFAMASNRWSNWGYASSRVFLSPFAWINRGPSTFNKPRSPAYVAEQLAAFRKWGMGGEIANFCYGGLKNFDYTPYVPAIRAAAEPAVVDSQPPRLEIVSPSQQGPIPSAAKQTEVRGFAVDDLAIRAVRWKNDRGGEGAARMTWQIESGDYKQGYRWRMSWAAEVPLRPGANRITVEAEDIKGLVASKVVAVESR